VDNAIEVDVRTTPGTATIGGGVHLADLVDGGEPGGDLAAPALGDLDHRERGEPVAHRRQVQLRRETAQHAALHHAIQAGLHGAPGHPEATGTLQHAQPRLVGQQQQQPPVQRVEFRRHR
jgi:hypothetical protein